TAAAHAGLLGLRRHDHGLQLQADGLQHRLCPRGVVSARILEGQGGAQMPDDRVVKRTAPVEARVDAIQAALEERVLADAAAFEALAPKAQEEWIPRTGARVVARAWTDPAFRARLLADGRSAVAELGLSMPAHHRHLVVLENAPKVQNV